MSTSEPIHQRPQESTPHKTDGRAQHAGAREFVPGLRAKQTERNDDGDVELPDIVIIVPATAPALDNAADHPVSHSYEIAPPDEPHELIRSHPHRHRIAPLVFVAAMSLQAHHNAFAHADAHDDLHVSCGIHTVSIIFSGVPGQRFKYDRLLYEIPPSGSIELIANQNVKTYEMDRLVLPLIGTEDQFSALSVRLPEPRHEAVQP